MKCSERCVARLTRQRPRAPSPDSSETPIRHRSDPQHAIDGKCLAQIDVPTLKSFFRKLPITKGKVATLVKRLEDLRVRGQGGDWFSMMSIESPAPAAAPAVATPAAEPAAASPATAAPAASTEAPVSTGEPAAPAPADSTAPAPAV